MQEATICCATPLTKLAPLNSASGKEFLVPGALLFIVKPGHNGKYNDELGDASHVGIYTQQAEVTQLSVKGVALNKNAWTHVGLKRWITQLHRRQLTTTLITVVVEEN